MDKCICDRPDLHTVDGAICCLGCGYYGAPQEHVTTASLNEHANYHYKSLESPSSIRLVRLCGGRRTDGIVCDIFHTALERLDEFEALSYTWGDGANFKTISTPEGRLNITENCYSALEDLRHEAKDRILWIDAICINQRSNSEKNHQVPLMNKIYKAAFQVVIYLGRDSQSPPSKEFFSLWRDTPTKHEPVSYRYLEGSLQYGQRDVSQFLSLPWWSRVWILQEVAVARKALLVWGASIIKWELFSTARVNRQGYLPVNMEGNIPPVLMFSGNDPKPLKSFDELMHTARCSRSSEPRDKIYALLGLLGEHVVHNMVADYNRPLSELHAEFALSIIESHRNLDLLCLLGRDVLPTEEMQIEMRRLGNLEQQIMIRSHHIEQNESLLKALHISIQETDPSLPAWSEAIASAQKVKLRIDELSQLVHAASKQIGLSPLSWKSVDAQSASNKQSHDAPRYYRKPFNLDLPSWVPQLDSLPKLTSLSRFYSARGSFTSVPHLCTESSIHNHPALKIRMHWIATVRSYGESSYATKGYKTQSSFLSSVLPSADADVHLEIQRFAKDRQVLFTRDSWVICSYDTRAGDQICLIDGARVPFVSRPLSIGQCRSFQLLGECYLDSIGYVLSRSRGLINSCYLSDFEEQRGEDACLV